MDTARKITDFMNDNMAVFIVPIYQRKYSWSKDNCRQLLNDLEKIVSNGSDRHFFGSIVAYGRITASSHEYHLIDGQQRLTTVTMIMLAIRNLVRDGKVHSENATIVDDINKSFLTSPSLPVNGNVKLRLGDDDSAALQRLFNGNENLFDGTSNLTHNYKYICERICDESWSVDDVYGAVQKLEIIPIILDDKDKPQLIFESLNSTGLALAEGDKIRNYILMGLSPEDQQRMYNEKWLEIESLTKDRVGDFTRYYLCIKNLAIPKFENVYRDFKKYAEEMDDGRKRVDVIGDILNDMLEYAQYYNILLTYDSGFGNDRKRAKMKDCLIRLAKLDFKVTYPFFMAVLHRHKNTHLSQSEKIESEDDVFEIFSIVENYLLRRIICDVAPNSLNKLFLMLDKEIYDYEGNSNDYVSKLVFALQRKNGTLRFPDDTEFLAQLASRDIYNMRSSYREYVLERYENYGTNETMNIYSQLKNKTLSIEHIMPQTLSRQWRHGLGNDCNRVHQTWLHKLGNLTLTGYNSNLHNHSFKQKRDAPDGGFKASNLRMNQWINKQDKWGENELRQRTDDMIKLAKDNIWKYPTTTFSLAEVALDEYTLDDADADFTSRKIASYSYKDDIQVEVPNWKELLAELVFILYDEDKSILYDIASRHISDTGLENCISLNPNDFNASFDINGEIYVNTNTDTNAKLSNLRRLFDLYNINYSDLVFYMQPNDKNVEPNKGHRSRSSKSRLNAISNIIQDWTDTHDEVKADIDHSDDKHTRFTTDSLDAFIRFANEGESDWGTENHHFYEVVNEKGKEIYIKLEFNSKNASREFLDFFERVRQSYSLKRKNDWKYREVFRTKSFSVGEDISEEGIFAGLDGCLAELIGLESDFISRPNLR